MAMRFTDSSDELELNHDINVTPFIDVMLVLLIIFMVAAPLATVDVKVDLPVSNAQSVKKPQQPVYLTIAKDGGLSVGNMPVARDQVGAAIAAATGQDREQRIFLRADKTVAYEQIMVAMNALRAAGYTRVALVGADQGTAK